MSARPYEEASEVPPQVLYTILERMVQPRKAENPAAHALAISLLCKVGQRMLNQLSPELTTLKPSDPGLTVLGVSA
jgi:hypothetical protein